MELKKNNKKISVFYTLILLVVLITLTGLYINNIVAFNNLMKNNKELKEKLVQINLDNNKKKMEIESLTSFMRVKTIVGDKLNMFYNENAIDKREIIISMKDTVKQ